MSEKLEMEEIVETNEENVETNETNELEPEKKSLFKRLKDPKYTKHKIIIVLLLLCIVGGLGIYVYNSLNWTAEKICRALVNQVSQLELVVLEENSKNNVGFFKDSTVKVEGIEYTGTIEVFENKTDALLKKEYYELYDTEMNKVFNKEMLGSELAKVYGTGKWTMSVHGNTLIRLSYHYSDYQTKQLIKQFNLVMDKTYQTEKNIPTESEQKTIQKNYIKQVEEEVKNKKDSLISALEGAILTLKAEAEQEQITIDRLLEIKQEAELYKAIGDLGVKALEIQTLVDNRIQSQVDHIDGILDEAQNNYSRDKVEEAKNAIALLTHEIFNEYKSPWNSRIEQILYIIKEKEIQDYKDQCTEYNYYDIDESYEGNYAYFYGKIYRISTNNNGRITLIVNVTPQYLLGSIAYWTNSVYVDMDEDISAFYDQGDLIEMWGQIDGMVVNEQVFGDAKSYPSFYCKYASE